MTDRDGTYFASRRKERKLTHKRVELQLTIQEYNDFKKIAEKEGLSPSMVIKNMSIAYKDSKYYIPHSVQESLNKLSFLVRNIANNLNQMSHSANVFGDIDRDIVFKHLKHW